MSVSESVTTLNLKTVLLSMLDSVVIRSPMTVNAGQLLSDLVSPSVDEVAKLISSMPNKSSPLDTIPTSVIKSCVEVFAPLISYLATLSFNEGIFPSCYGTVSVTLLLKKMELDPDVPGNYCPVSNLHTVSKIVERLFLNLAAVWTPRRGHTTSVICNQGIGEGILLKPHWLGSWIVPIMRTISQGHYLFSSIFRPRLIHWIKIPCCEYGSL